MFVDLLVQLAIDEVLIVDRLLIIWICYTANYYNKSVWPYYKVIHMNNHDNSV